MRPARTLMLRAFADARLRTLCFAAFFFLYGLVQPIGYAKAYPKLADRIGLAQSFGTNPALQLFYGAPHQLQTVGGYTAWRVGGFTALVAAFVGLLAAVRAFRGEEESGRFEIVAVGAISRRAAFASRLAAIGLMIAALWLALALGVLLGGLSASPPSMRPSASSPASSCPLPARRCNSAALSSLLTSWCGYWPMSAAIQVCTG
jgi:ABC-2 type transport system permease protein